MAVFGNRPQESRGNTLVTNFNPGPGEGAGGFQFATAAPIGTFDFEEGVNGTSAVAHPVSGVVLYGVQSAWIYDVGAAFFGTLGIRTFNSNTTMFWRTPSRAAFSASIYAFASQELDTVTTPTANIFQGRNSADNTVPTRIRLNGATGQIEITGVSATTVIGSSTTTIGVSDQFRLDVTFDYTTPTAAVVTVRMFVRSNVQGTVPDETVTSSAFSTFAGTGTGPPDLLALTGTVNWEWNYDQLRISDGLVFLGPDTSGLTSVTATRATSWDTLTPVTSTRATSWTTQASVAGAKATTWNTQTSVSSTRATTWNTLAPIAGTRATTWNTRAGVTATRATTWNAAASVNATRATTWTTFAVVTGTRATTWSTLASVAATRQTTWNVAGNLASVTATRSTTWAVIGRATASRATTWNTLASVSPSTRATSWTALSSTSATRATTWRVLAAVGNTRSTLWVVLAQVTATRQTRWDTLTLIVVTRGTSWAVGGVVTLTLADVDITVVATVLPRTFTADNLGRTLTAATLGRTSTAATLPRTAPAAVYDRSLEED